MEISNDKPIRKRKYNPDKLGAKCRACKEMGNLENLIRQQLSIKNKAGKEIHQAFKYAYFCSSYCQTSFINY